METPHPEMQSTVNLTHRIDPLILNDQQNNILLRRKYEHWFWESEEILADYACIVMSHDVICNFSRARSV